MLTFTSIATFVALRLLALTVAPSLVDAAPFADNTPATSTNTPSTGSSSTYWLADIKRQGTVPFGASGYKVFRNVKDYGAKGKLTNLVHVGLCANI